VGIALLAAAMLGWAVRPRSTNAPRLAAVATIAVVGCVPWLAHPYRLTGHPVYWGSSSGLSLFWMSPTQPGETGQWHEPSTVARDPALAAFRPLFRRLETLDPVHSDRELRRRAIANIRARPAHYARNVAANAGRLFFSIPMRPRRSLTRIGANVLFNSLLLVAVGWSAVLLWHRRPWCRRRPRPSHCSLPSLSPFTFRPRLRRACSCPSSLRSCGSWPKPSPRGRAPPRASSQAVTSSRLADREEIRLIVDRCPSLRVLRPAPNHERSSGEPETQVPLKCQLRRRHASIAAYQASA